MVKIAIVDDEPVFQREMKSLLEKYMRKQGEACSFSVFSDANELLDAYDYSFDVIFLDIEMGKSNGLDICHELLQINPRTNVVFLTSYIDYSFDAWKTGACGFLMKPLTEEKVKKQLSLLRYPFGGGRI